MASNLKNAIKQGNKGMFIADAVSMPVHWYYDVPKIKEDFNGWISKFEKPKDNHPLAAAGLTRPNPIVCDGKKIYVVGDVILQGKGSAYTKDAKANHYHQGMKAGDNTLNCYTSLLMIRTLKTVDASMSKEEIAKRFFSNYVKIMTTPGSHPDTFAESHHRNFFAEWVLAGRPTEPDAVFKLATECADKNFANPSSEHAPYIGSFAIPIPLVLQFSSEPVDKIVAIAKEIYSRTHPVQDVVDAMDSFIRLLHAVVHGAPLKEQAEKAFLDYVGSKGKGLLERFDKLVAEAGTEKLGALQSIGKELGLSCPVKKAYPVMLYLARHFHDDFEGGVLANANVGGDNCARAPPLGALLGAALGAKGQNIPEKWYEPLVIRPLLDQLL